MYLTIGVAVLSMAIFPATLCFDCEPDYTYGRSQAINDLGWYVFEFWLLVIPPLFGFLQIRRAWIIPIAISIANIATQHLGGAPWWTIANNEGPVILLIAIPVGFASLGAGVFCRLALGLPQRRITRNV